MKARLRANDILILLVNDGAKPVWFARHFGVKHQTMYRRLNKIARASRGPRELARFV